MQSRTLSVMPGCCAAPLASVGDHEDVIEAVIFAPRHGLGPGVMAIAPEGDARCRPTLPDVPHETAQMSTHLDAGRRLTRPQHDRDRAAAFGVIDMDRQEAALVPRVRPEGRLHAH